MLREARAVRRSVGICDVSTLGKIDVQGRDAAAFLDRIYANTFSTLPVGRARYGVMLREDGMVFDDGTTSRLGEHHFLITTTTANAAAVLEHMEYHAQVDWPDLDVQFCSVTDQWAQIAVAGPNARRRSPDCVEGLDLGNEAFPFMARRPSAHRRRVRCALFRISFSGELAYEVAMPAGYAERVWTALLAAGKPFGIMPYGLDAMGVHARREGPRRRPRADTARRPPRDLGLERMLKKSGDFIGRVNAMRPGLLAPDRPTARRRPGRRSELRAAPARRRAHRCRGASRSRAWAGSSSITRSVELERWIGLALVSGGAERIGQRMFATSPLHNEIVEVEITSPHHVDPENRRVRA